jgi:alpha-1,2-mannosyltransferase
VLAQPVDITPTVVRHQLEPRSPPIDPGTDPEYLHYPPPVTVTTPAGGVDQTAVPVPAVRIRLAWVVGVVSTAAAVAAAVAMASGEQLDFSVYLMGAHHLADGRLYQTSLAEFPHLPFTYPPFAALAFFPLTWLPMRAAQVTWSLVSVAALFGLVWLSIRAALPTLERTRSILLALVLMSPAVWLEPVHLTFFFGQVNIVLAAMVLADLTTHLRLGPRALPRGVLVGVAAAVKLVPLVFVPYLFLTRQTRAAWVALVTFGLCSALDAGIDPRVSWAYWTKYVADAKRVGSVVFISNQSLRAVADRLDHRVLSNGLVATLSAVVLIAGVVLAGWAYETSSNLLGVLVCATTGLVVSPITWAHHLVWVVPVLVWLAWAPDRPAYGRLWAVAGAALFWWSPIWTVPGGVRNELSEHGWQLLLGNSFFLAMVAFLVGITALLVVRRRSPIGSAGRPDVHQA